MQGAYNQVPPPVTDSFKWIVIAHMAALQVT